MVDDLDRRRSVLTTALVGALLPPDVPEGHMPRGWLDTWAGVGHILDAMIADGYYVELRESVFAFYREAMHHSHIGPAGSPGMTFDEGHSSRGGTRAPCATARQQSSAQSLACHESADNHLGRLSAPVTSETTPCVDPHTTQAIGDGPVSDTARAIVANMSPTISDGVAGTLEVRSRSHGRRRRAFYGCASYHRRGPKVCANKLEVPLDVADRVLLDVIEEEILHPDTVEAATNEALKALRRPAIPDADPEADLKRQLREVETQIANVTGAVKLGGHLPSLVAEMRSLEGRRAALSSKH